MKLRLFTTLVLALALAAPAYASTFEGTLTTGIQTSVEGTVIVAPTANPIAGIYTSTQNVVLSALGAQFIRYRDDGGVPTCSTGTLYTGSITVSSSVSTIQARSCYANNASSSPAVFLYAINPPSAPAPSGGGGGGGGGSSLPPPAVVGDATGDSIVNVLDFNAVLVAWGSTGGSIPADLNRDGIVDILDFNVLIINWTP